jgi:hypothetical protein
MFQNSPNDSAAFYFWRSPHALEESANPGSPSYLG